MRPFLEAIAFLTILPLPRCLRGSDVDLSESVAAFPLVGLVLGLAMVATDLILSTLFPANVVSVLLVLSLLILSGALHLDGLADTADGFLSSRPRTRILEIMKDSHVGPMGVAAIVVLLVLKVTLFASLPSPQRMGALAVSPLMSRCAMVWIMQLLSYARDEGTGRAFAGRPAWRPIVSALLFPSAISFFFLGWDGLLVCLSCLGVTALLALWFWRKIGGWTGDTLGATSEIVEVVPAFVVIAIAAGRAG